MRVPVNTLARLLPVLRRPWLGLWSQGLRSGRGAVASGGEGLRRTEHWVLLNRGVVWSPSPASA